jgi:hypothetical protein
MINLSDSFDEAAEEVSKNAISNCTELPAEVAELFKQIRTKFESDPSFTVEERTLTPYAGASRSIRIKAPYTGNSIEVSEAGANKADLLFMGLTRTGEVTVIPDWSLDPADTMPTLGMFYGINKGTAPSTIDTLYQHAQNLFSESKTTRFERANYGPSSDMFFVSDSSADTTGLHSIRIKSNGDGTFEVKDGSKGDAGSAMKERASMQEAVAVLIAFRDGLTTGAQNNQRPRNQPTF